MRGNSKVLCCVRIKRGRNDLQEQTEEINGLRFITPGVLIKEGPIDEVKIPKFTVGVNIRDCTHTDLGRDCTRDSSSNTDRRMNWSDRVTEFSQSLCCPSFVSTKRRELEKEDFTGMGYLS